MDKAFLKINDVKDILGVSKAWIYHLIYTREIPACLIGKSIFIPKSEFDAWLNRKRQESTTEGPWRPRPRKIKGDSEA